MAMKRQTKERSRSVKPKIFGANSFNVSEDDASWLVGGVVEKGFSDDGKARSFGPSAAPRPSVWPFPVARHRSDGPHWAPNIGNFDGNNGDYDGMDDETGEEKDFSGMILAADAANPIHRKEKKSTDFRRWREIMKNDGSAALHGEGKGIYLTSLRVDKQVNESSPNVSDTELTSLEDAKSCNMSDGICAWEPSTMPGNKAPTRFKDIQEEFEGTSKMDTTYNENFVQPVQQTQAGISDFDEIYMNSLESQIDAENRARLAKMSATEIAEAQAEIMAKLNPELIKALKKRSQEKAKKLKMTSPDVGEGGQATAMQHSENIPKLFANSDQSNAFKHVTEVFKDMPTEEQIKFAPKLGQENISSWNAWSKRVERVRTLRFSLDGNIVDSNLTDKPNAGESMFQDGYSPDTVSERDFLRTEGDPGAVGYTIKEAVALTRSVVPGQRTLALHLIASVLDRAICSICQNQAGSLSRSVDAYGSVDWEAIWAFTLGPEPELALLLRMSLDDNHNSVILACAKAIQCALNYDMNEVIFDISEATNNLNDVFTAPVFRGKPDINAGFLHGGFWKYSAKPSNIDLIGEELGDESEGERTIQDDVVVAGQDIAAGLVRMGILSRICYLMETDPSAALEENLLSILIAIARHSPTCAAAVINCERLIETVANRFALKELKEVNACKIKSVMLIKVLARFEKKSCSTFLKNGVFRRMTWQLYQHPFSFEQWVKSGREVCKYLSALIVEQLRLLKVFINYGYCVPDFSDLFASVCIWLSVPKIHLLIENGVMNEYFSIIKEVYILLDILASKLPNFYSVVHETMEVSAQVRDSWSWSHFGPIIDLALEWIEVKSIPYISWLFGFQTEDGRFHNFPDSEVNSLLWVISSVLKMLSSLVKAVVSEDTSRFPNGKLPWIPEFVPKIGLGIIRNKYLGSFGENAFDNEHPPENGSIVECFFHLRLKGREETAISSSCCLQALICLVASVDKLIQCANLETCSPPSKICSPSRDDKILANGTLKFFEAEVRGMLTMIMSLFNSEWQYMQSIEVFARGGPAPGVGVGWGASGGGYWSLRTMVALQDARLLANLLEVSEITSFKDPANDDEMSCSIQMLNCALTTCLTVGPGSSVLDMLLNFIFQVPVMKSLDVCIRRFVSLRKELKPSRWNYQEDDYLLFADVLAAHFRGRWLRVKKKSKSMRETNNVSHKVSKTGSQYLDTIQEDNTLPNMVSEETTSMTVEWAYQRLPLPAHWFLSAISDINLEQNALSSNSSVKCHEVIKGGLFFLLGIEAIPSFLNSETCSPLKCIPIVWKLHALSVVLLSGMSFLEDDKSRDTYETLQNVYGEILNQKALTSLSDNLTVDILKFEAEIHENYTSFIETLVEQFAAESFGDLAFGRQVAMYLHRSVEASVRLATWNALSNARALELLPPLDQCLTKIEGYLEPIEDNERILEAYAKSWVSGALDKAVSRSSLSFSLVLHHLSCFMFRNCASDMLPLRNKLVRQLLRDCSHKPHHEGMLVTLTLYKKSTMATAEIDERLHLLKEICKGSSLLMASAEKIEARARREFPTET